MLGLFLDNIIIFVFRLVMRAFHLFRSRDWPKVSGKIEWCESSELTSYPYVDLSYSYVADGLVCYGSYRKGLLVERFQ